TKPHAQIDAPGIHPRDPAKIENHNAPSTAVQEQVGGPQRLFEPLPRLCTSRFLPQRVCWIGFAKCRQKPRRSNASPRRFSVSLDLFSRARSDDMDSRRFCECSLPPDQTRDGLIDAAHQFAGMSPTMYLHWLFARGIKTASLSDFLVRRSKVRRALEIRL